MDYDWEFHDGNTSEQAPAILPLIGKTIAGVWLLPDGVFVSFLDGQILEAKPAKPIAGFKVVWAVRIGETKEPGFDWHTVLDQSCGQPPPCVFMRGMPFQGFDHNVIMFGVGYGIRVTEECAVFVRTPEAPELFGSGGSIQ